MRDLLVAFQVALTILLLAAAGGAMRSFVNVYHTKLGYDPHDVLTVSISLPDGSYTTYETRAAFYGGIHKRVAALSGIMSASVGQKVAQFPTRFLQEPLHGPLGAIGFGSDLANFVPVDAQLDHGPLLRREPAKGFVNNDSQAGRRQVVLAGRRGQDIGVTSHRGSQACVTLGRPVVDPLGANLVERQD